MVSFYVLSGQFSVLVSCHMIKTQEIGFTKALKSGMKGGWPFIGFQLAMFTVLHIIIICLEPLLNCRKSMLFQVLGLWLHLKYSS